MNSSSQDRQTAQQELRKQFARLSEKRRLYVASEVKAKRIDISRAFDTAVRQVVREELEREASGRVGARPLNGTPTRPEEEHGNG